MKSIRRVLQFTFIITNLIGLFLILSYTGAFEDYVSVDLVEQYVMYVPYTFLTVAIALIVAFTAPDSRIALIAFLIPILPTIGALLKSKSKWAYRILVYPIIALSALISFIEIDANTGLAVSIIYLIVAVLIDALP